MTLSPKILWWIGILLALAGISWWLLHLPSASDPAPAEPTPSAQPTPTSEPMASETSTPSAPATKFIAASTIEKADPAFTFGATVPSRWEVEAIPAIEAISFYDPAAPGATTRDKSQIFIRHFRAANFLTLSTVTIHDRTELTVNDRPAVRYDIEKKSGVADFPHQPSWRNQRHIVTDIRVADVSPSEFYVIAQHPDLDPAVYERFLSTFEVVVGPNDALVPPVADMQARITKKQFGQFITPETSPVQPERFRGYHTGVDVEYDDITEPVPVVAIADGEVVIAQTADGYGGVVAIRHTLSGKTLTAIYGHLQPDRLPRVGATVTRGEQIGILGESGTAATDGERKHLHFGLVRGSTADLRGYVADKNALADWADPLNHFDR